MPSLEMAVLDPVLEAAYRHTAFRVSGAAPAFVLRIDQFSAPLAALHQTRRVHSSAFISACNPRSEVQTDAVNAARQAQLKDRLRAHNLEWLDGIGEDPDGRWPGEPSVLVLGIDPVLACQLGEDFGQNAIVCCPESAVPELVILGPCTK